MRTLQFIAVPKQVGNPNGTWCVRSESIDLIRTMADCPTQRDAEHIAQALTIVMGIYTQSMPESER